jgi:hypothetical protein
MLTLSGDLLHVDHVGWKNEEEEGHLNTPRDRAEDLQ